MTMSWDDNIDWGDDDLSNPANEDLIHQKYRLHAPSTRKLSKSNTVAPRQVTPPKSQGRLGKRSSWFDWFESDEEGSTGTTNSSNSNQRDRKTNKSIGTSEEVVINERSKIEEKGFLPQSLLSLVPLEDEGMSTKQYKKIARRRTVETMGNDEAGLKSLRERAKRPSKDLCKLVKKGSKNGYVSKTSSSDKLQVPFPSRPRRRSAW